MDHLGSGREWDLLRKNGGLSIFPPYAEKNMKVYSGRVQALESILPFLKNKKEKYVIMTDANIAVDFDFGAMLQEHIESGADVSIAYTEQEIPEELIRAGVHEDMYYTLCLKDGRVRRIFMNSEEPWDPESFDEYLYYGTRSVDREDPWCICSWLLLF